MSMVDDQPTAALLDGRYRLEECVGRGGTALVYRAEDTALGRTVAIKILRQPDEMPTSMERARGESAVLATLNHRSLVTLYDARLEPGHPQYMVMEYVHGPTLAMRLVRGPLSSFEAAALARDIASGLQTVHEAGIIHRDVKPSNILMSASTRADREWTAKLADFGIAFGMDDPRLTSPGIAVGTAAYMAPEQVRNDPLTPAVDVYSLGLVLIEALTGEPAFPMTGGVQTALRRLSGPPPLPASLDDGWRELLRHMTRAEPGERPSAREVAETAAAFATAVARVATGSSPSRGGGIAPADDPTPTREYPVARPAASATGARRRRVAAGGIAAAAVASIIALAGAQSMSAPADAPKETVVLEPVTSSPGPVLQTAQPDQERASTAVTGGDSSGKAKAKPGKAKAGPPAKDEAKTAANVNKGPGKNAGKAGKGPGSGDKAPPKGEKK